MKNDTNDQPGAAGGARARLREIAAIYLRLKKTIETLLAQQGEPDPAFTKQVLNKISEMQTAHLMVVRAEEVFHEKFGSGSDGNEGDHAAIRAELGRRLDRLRTAGDQERLSGQPVRD